MNISRLFLLAGFLLRLVPAQAQEKEYWFWASQGDSAMFANNPTLSNNLFYKAFTFLPPYSHHWYGMSGNFAMLSQIDSSFKYLDLAIKGGFNNLENIENNDILKILHSDPRWGQLLNPVRAERAAKLKADGVNMEVFTTLNDCAKAEQSLRKKMNSSLYTQAQKDSIFQVIQRVDKANQATLKGIIQKYGWPTGKSPEKTVPMPPG
jgi:hypothetical protein